jgi:hypothetical protein
MTPCDRVPMSQRTGDVMATTLGFATCTILVAQDGKVLLAKGLPRNPHPRYMPTTTVPNLRLGDTSTAFDALATQLKGQVLSGPSAAAPKARRASSTQVQASLQLTSVESILEATDHYSATCAQLPRACREQVLGCPANRN